MHEFYRCINYRNSHHRSLVMHRAQFYRCGHAFTSDRLLVLRQSSLLDRNQEMLSRTRITRKGTHQVVTSQAQETRHYLLPIVRSSGARSPGFEDLAPGLHIDGRSRGRRWRGDRFAGFAASAPGLVIDGRRRVRWWRRDTGARLRCPKARRPSGGGGAGVVALLVHTAALGTLLGTATPRAERSRVSLPSLMATGDSGSFLLRGRRRGKAG